MRIAPLAPRPLALASPAAPKAPPTFGSSGNATDMKIYRLLHQQQSDFDSNGLFQALVQDGDLDLGGSIPGEWRTEYAGGKNRLVPPGASVDYAGGQYLVVPAGWDVDYANGMQRLVPPGGDVDYAGGAYRVAPAGWDIDYAGGRYLAVPNGGSVDYAGGNYRVVPDGWRVEYAGGKYLVVPPGARVDYNGGNYVVVPSQPLSWLDQWFLDQVDRTTT